MKRQVMCNAPNNCGGTHYLPTLIQGSSEDVHTRGMMKVKRTSWHSMDFYRRYHILLGRLCWVTYWVIPYDSNADAAYPINSTLIVMTHAESLVLTRRWHIILMIVVIWVIPNTIHTHYDSCPSKPFHSLLSNQNMHVPIPSYGKTLPGSCDASCTYYLSCD